MHFVMYAFSNHAVVLHNVTPIDLSAQSAVLSDGVVVACLQRVTPLDLLAQVAGPLGDNRRFYLWNARLAASSVCSKTSVSCATETKHASYGDGGK